MDGGYQPMKVLVTGGAGFIGSNVVNLLLGNDFGVVILDNLSTGYRENINPRATFMQGDIRDGTTLEKAARGCQAIFHLAASVGNLRSLQDPLFDSDVNLLGTLNVLEMARRLGVKKVVFSSSAAIFGEVKKLPQDEEHPQGPDSPYGVSKLAAEKQCLCYNKLYGMKTVCLRYFNVYGPYQRYDAYGNVIPIFATRLKEEKPLTIYGDGNQTRDFVAVQDVAQANFLAATNPDVSGSFNIGSGVQTTIMELARLCRETFQNNRSPVQFAPSRPGEVLHSVADISKATRLLGYKPQIRLSDGLPLYFQWLKTI